MKIHFTKMSGAGNDFIVVDNRLQIIADPQKFSQLMCDRRRSIGADGVLLLEVSDRAAYQMKYFNADGSNAGMCGNGGRCLAKFAFDLGMVDRESFKFEAFGHIYTVLKIDSTTYELTMINPFDLKQNQLINVDDSQIKGNFLNTGTDHSIILLKENSDLGELDSVDVFTLGKKLRFHEIYQPKGTNVNFVEQIDSKSIKIRTFERGVEDETLACGTGSVASALVCSLKFGMRSPISVKTKSGETLDITFDKNKESFLNVRLKGSAIATFRGETEYTEG